MFMIHVTNSIDLPVLDHNGEISRNRMEDGHGYGIRTVEKILEKYDGFVSFNENDLDFIATALVPFSRIT